MQNGRFHLGRRITRPSVFYTKQVDASTNQLNAAFKSRSVILVDRRSQELAFKRAIAGASILDG